MGSWSFLIGQALFLAFWFVFNSLAFTGVWHYDPYPYILCNLFMSAEAAFASPLILMASNRQAARDRARDNLEAEEISSIFASHDLLLQINQQQLALLKQQAEMLHVLKPGKLD